MFTLHYEKEQGKGEKGEGERVQAGRVKDERGKVRKGKGEVGEKEGERNVLTCMQTSSMNFYECRGRAFCDQRLQMLLHFHLEKNPGTRTLAHENPFLKAKGTFKNDVSLALLSTPSFPPPLPDWPSVFSFSPTLLSAPVSTCQPLSAHV